MKLALNMKVSNIETCVLVSRYVIPPKRRKSTKSKVFRFCFVKAAFLLSFGLLRPGIGGCFHIGRDPPIPKNAFPSLVI